MKEKQNDIGVIIGRFQVHELHTAHINLISTVIENHPKVVILLGTTIAIGTKRNPLDFITRKIMIENVFGSSIIAILPLPDQKSDAVWSAQIHTKIREILPFGDVTLYGSKDSFIPHYKGTWKTCELVPDSYISATNIREKISKTTLGSSDFRAGVIYSIYSQYPIMFSTIDVLIYKDNQVLLGRKKNEITWRFIGGFVDPSDTSDEYACKREVMEETGLEISDLQFVCSRNISDWRYKGVTDRGIMTHFYIAKYTFGIPEPMDDIEELKWFDLDKISNILVTEHDVLFKEYLKFKDEHNKSN